jgi:hypothetical protein
MAWTRTGLAVLVNALIVLRAGGQSGRSSVLALGFLLLAAAGGAVAAGAWRARRLARGADPATPLALILATVGVAWLASAAVVAAVAGAP